MFFLQVKDKMEKGWCQKTSNLQVVLRVSRGNFKSGVMSIGT